MFSAKFPNPVYACGKDLVTFWGQWNLNSCCPGQARIHFFHIKANMQIMNFYLETFHQNWKLMHQKSWNGTCTRVHDHVWSFPREIRESLIPKCWNIVQNKNTCLFVFTGCVWSSNCHRCKSLASLQNFVAAVNTNCFFSSDVKLSKAKRSDKAGNVEYYWQSESLAE